MSYPRVYLQLLLALSALCLCAFSQSSSVIQVQDSRDPYLLLATASKIERMNLDGTNITLLINDTLGIAAFDYHYERNLIFWVTKRRSDMKYASLSDGSNVVSLRLRNMREPSGIAVDWLNDKVYWADREQKGIYAYDLNTWTETPNKIADIVDSNPQKLKIFPQTDAGWLYIGDRKRKGIYRIEISTGEEMQVVGGSVCPTSLSLDYTTRDLYWTDLCKFEIRTSKIDGSHLQTLLSETMHFFSYGSSVYNNHLFWTQAGKNTTVDCIERRTSTNHRVYTAELSLIPQDLEIVHPSLQPPMEVLGTFATCEQGCVNGNCMHTDVCACYEGWTGDACEIDIDECEEETSGCQQNCVNNNGGFQCECSEGGLVLAEDQKSCVSPSSTTEAITTPPPTTTSPPTTPPTTPRPTTPPTTPRPTTPPTTSRPTTPPTTSRPTTPPTTPPPPTTSRPTTSRPTSQPTTTTTPSTPTPTEATPTISTTTVDTTTPKTDLEQTTTQDLLLPPDDGLKTNDEMPGSTKLILIVVFTAVGFIIIVGVSLYLVFLFFKYKRGKTGSYDVYERHSSPGSLHAQRTRLQSMVESGTSSAHSSFRDITDQCNRSRLLSGVMSAPAMRAESVSASIREGSVPASVREGSVVSGDSSTDEYRWSSASAGLMTGLITVPRVHQGHHSTFKQSL